MYVRSNCFLDADICDSAFYDHYNKLITFEQPTHGTMTVAIVVVKGSTTSV